VSSFLILSCFTSSLLCFSDIVLFIIFSGLFSFHFVSSHFCYSLPYSWSRLHRWCNDLAGGSDSDNYLKCVCVCVTGAGTDAVTHHCVSAKSIKRTQLIWSNFSQTKKINMEQHAHTDGYICASNNNNMMGKRDQTSVIFLCLCHITLSYTCTTKSHKRQQPQLWRVWRPQWHTISHYCFSADMCMFVSVCACVYLHLLLCVYQSICNFLFWKNQMCHEIVQGLDANDWQPHIQNHNVRPKGPFTPRTITIRITILAYTSATAGF